MNLAERLMLIKFLDDLTVAHQFVLAFSTLVAADIDRYSGL
jgi:hypothetical protein